MGFDIDEVVNGMLSEIKDTVDDNWKKVKDIAKTYTQNKKARLDLLANMRLHNEIDQELFEKRIKDEKKILESELLSLRIITNAIAQKAANAALDVLSNAVSLALKI